MSIITCTTCGSVVDNIIDINICANCIKFGNDSVKILAIKKYIEKYPNSNIRDIVDSLPISKEDINRFIEEGSLILNKQDGVESISSPIKSKKVLRREEFIKQLSNLPKNSSDTYKNIDSRSKLVKDLERLKNAYNNEKDIIK